MSKCRRRQRKRVTRLLRFTMRAPKEAKYVNPQLIKVKVSGGIPLSFGLDYKACINQQRYCVLECVPDVFSAYTFLENTNAIRT
ncbi:hypothetical protein APHMUC_1386 [Anaplasma phagocytophilum str. ApMUC09]|uniref:Uncharacterized protein n=1 Tax=Anaplasma phagocytophilum str. ApMUC09 TaxID=1359152 RepID=A0A0F3NA11_ANAPH|nr:hypothetical protein APHMUC_1386 [Anaplasma phagocytophilum str. ApMUC09]